MKNNFILAPVLIPNKKIIRNANNIINEPHEVYFTEETIAEIRNDFHKQKFENEITINHNGETISGLIMSKSFLIDKKNVNDLPGNLIHLPIGTWIIGYYVENDNVWKMLKENILNGFSFEGIFQYDDEHQETEDITVKDDNPEKLFDDILFQISKGNTHENLDNNFVFSEFEILKDWKSKFGYSFNIYGNDHFIDNKPHFHFDNKQENLSCKIGFDGEIFEIKGSKNISKSTLKELKYFLSKPNTQKILKEMWNNKNPDLTVE
jgi:predicted nucleic acid-binding protein